MTDRAATAEPLVAVTPLPKDPEPRRATPAGLSVVIPALNEAAALPATIEAIRASAAVLAESVGEQVEVIVVDDRSSDETALIATQLADRVVPGLGVSIGAARNAGAQVARGGTLVFVDADARVEPGVLPAIAAAVADGALAGSIRPTYWSPRPSVQLLLRFWDWYAPRHDITQGVCQFFARAVFESLGGYRVDLLMAEDTDLYHRARRRFGPSTCRSVTEAVVHPSMRRYEQVSALRLWWQMNPITTRFFRRSRWLWRNWYVDPPR